MTQDGYRGFPSKQAYEEHYSDITKYRDELPAMEAYVQQQRTDRLEAIVDELQGTCKSLSEVLTDDEREDAELLAWIDDRLFCCSVCDWWCETDEESDEGGVCTDCHDPD